MAIVTHRGNKRSERGRRINLLQGTAHNEGDTIIARGKQKYSNAWECRSEFKALFIAMNRRILVGLVLIVIIVIVVVTVLLVTLGPSSSKEEITYCVTLKGERTCHSTDFNPYRYYGTKTAYHISSHNTTDDHFHFDDCVPKVFYLLSRHATRYPDQEEIEEMIETLPFLRQKIINASHEGKSNICKTDIEKLKIWNFTMVPEDDNRLSLSGEEEAIALAQRYKRRFPGILDKDFSPNSFMFQYTSRERTLTTAESFAKGLFGRNRSIHFYGQTNDKVLQFHKTCKKLQKQCNDSKANLVEIEKFEKGPFIKAIVKSISKRLGFTVSYEEVQMMYRMCNFGYALQEDDIWCSVFSKDELKVLEYEADIDDYYKDGYGNKLNYEQACPVVDYLIHLFKSSMHRSDRRAVLQFSHAGAIKKVYPRLGLFRDTIPLTSENFCSRHDRKWKSSLIAPFNSNIAIVLFQCDEEHKIAAFHNEEPVTLGGCKSTLCPIHDFFEAYKNVSENCNINNMCCTCCIE